MRTFDDWTTGVEAAPEAQANAAFEDWKKRNAGLARRLNDDDIAKDWIRGLEGRLLRFRVRLPASNPEEPEK